MRRRATIILCVLMTAIGSLSASKLFPDEHHFISVWGSFGYSGLLNNANGVKTHSGVAPAAGVGYRYFKDGLIVQAGFEGQYAWMQSNLSGLSQKAKMMDADNPNEEFIMNASLSNHKDICQVANVNIPVLIGLERGYVYFLAGAAVGLNVYGKTSASGILTTRGEYERYIGIFEEMPNHGLASQKVKSGDKDLSMNLNLMLHGEIGARVDRFFKEKGADVPKHKYRMYVALFAEYGLLNVHKDESLGKLVSLDFSNGVNAGVNPAMLSDQMKGARVNPLTVGVKFTVLFELPKPKVCLMCREN